ncbi:MAG: hypothetical protein ACRCZP_19335 [Phycicoccus sp.]
MTTTVTPWPAARPTAWTRLVAAAEQAVSRVGDDLAQAQDATARAHGIGVTRMPWGGRRYTHPGFAARAHLRTIEGELS